jgi:hypothetical protein
MVENYKRDHLQFDIAVVRGPESSEGIVSWGVYRREWSIVDDSDRLNGQSIPETPATLTAEITLVEHGYQIDIINRARATSDGNGVVKHSICRDFGGHYDIAALADTLDTALADLMDNIESIHRERIRQGKRTKCVHCGKTVAVNDNGKVRLHRNQRGTPCPAAWVKKDQQ